MISSGFSLGAENLEERVGTPIRPLPSTCPAVDWTAVFGSFTSKKKVLKCRHANCFLENCTCPDYLFKERKASEDIKILAEIIVPWNGQKFSEETFQHLWKTWLHWRSRSFRSLTPNKPPEPAGPLFLPLSYDKKSNSYNSRNATIPLMQPPEKSPAPSHELLPLRCSPPRIAFISPWVRIAGPGLPGIRSLMRLFKDQW